MACGACNQSMGMEVTSNGNRVHKQQIVNANTNPIGQRMATEKNQLSKLETEILAFKKTQFDNQGRRIVYK